ncbi:MAG: ribosome assembly factor SBDS [Candidatus Marsarchaeota archaeon]|jgi:ribosome maturation protein SDO1|nr:ribosome assembly factor SBDS [Candidatus Marsarchaeota archaeon]MCL5418680.1 ribosome assembly factor SBDS [Candidatus Marsarchaeota archaeon]
MPSSKSIIVKLSKSGEEFEILVDSELAYEYITGKRSDPMSVIEAEEIFKDARKGERQSEGNIRKVFGTTELAKVVEYILKNADIPLTTEQRNRLLEEKRKQIIDIIAKNSIDPRTNAPNPPLRIENAMKEARVSINPFRSASEQIEEVVKKLNVYMPIKFTTVKIEVVIPPEFANRCYGILKHFGLKGEQWLSNGSLEATVEFPAGMRNDFFDKINGATQGMAQIKIES